MGGCGIDGDDEGEAEGKDVKRGERSGGCGIRWEHLRSVYTSHIQYSCSTYSTCVILTPRRTALVAAAKTGSPALTIWPKDTAPNVNNGER